MNQKEKAALLAAAVGAGLWLYGRRRRRRFDFAGKVVVVTGSSRGLGLVLARQLARQQAHVVLCARDAQELDRAWEDVSQHGPPPLALPCDLTEADQVVRLLQTVEQRLGPVDVLINNAGTIAVGPQESMTLADYHEAMASNFYSAVHAVQAVLPSMQGRQTGRIVNVTSVGGKVSVPHLLPYCSSKFALVGFSEGLRAELAPHGITVTTVCPGLMRTGSPRNADFKGRHRQEYTWFALSDSLPLLSMSAESAAAQVLEACRRGDAEVVLSLPARLAVAFHGLFPGLTADLLALTDRLLPGMGGIGTARAKGRDSESALAPSWLTGLTEAAARHNNELATNP
jgi:NAD(P)-dependent dehydrogenase (short-subunit alcohol dehydrogenase family)